MTVRGYNTKSFMGQRNKQAGLFDALPVYKTDFYKLHMRHDLGP